MGIEKTLTQAGTGSKPKQGDTCTVHCTGIVTATGKKFWSTKDPGQSTFSFQVGKGRVIRGWDEGVIGMNVGEHATFVLSSDYAYGDGGFPAWGIPPKATLTFEIELISAKSK